jgi:hypothetical protein
LRIQGIPRGKKAEGRASFARMKLCSQREKRSRSSRNSQVGLQMANLRATIIGRNSCQMPRSPRKYIKLNIQNIQDNLEKCHEIFGDG